MSLEREALDFPLPGFPRVSGDEPGADELVFTARRFSPRERG